MSAKFLKRYEPVFLVNHLKEPKLTNKAVAKYIRKSGSFVKKWETIFGSWECGRLAGERTNARDKTKQDKAILSLFQNKNRTFHFIKSK